MQVVALPKSVVLVDESGACRSPPFGLGGYLLGKGGGELVQQVDEQEVRGVRWRSKFSSVLTSFTASLVTLALGRTHCRLVAMM